MPLRMEMQKRDGNYCDTLQNGDAKAKLGSRSMKAPEGPHLSSDEPTKEEYMMATGCCILWIVVLIATVIGVNVQ